MKWLALTGASVVSAMLLVTGCASTPSKPEAAKPVLIAALPALANSKPPVPTVADMTAMVAKKTNTLLGGGYQVATQGRSRVDLPMRQNTAGLLTAMDQRKRVVARAIVVHLDGFAATPIPVDYTSTALTRLITTPPLLTRDPVSILLIGAAAQRSPHLAALAKAMEAHANQDPNYLSMPTTNGEAIEYAGLANDVLATLTEWARSVKAPQAVGSAFPSAMLASFSNEGAKPCENAEQIKTVKGDDGLRLCLASAKPGTGQGKSVLVVDAQNQTPSWAAVYSSTNELLGMVPPRIYVLPQVTDLLDALKQTAMSIGVKGWVAGACGFAGHFGGKCPDDWTSINPFAAFESLMKKSDDGEGNLAVTAQQAKHPMYAVTVGSRGGDLLPSGISLQTKEVVPFVLTAWSQIGDPLVSLILDSSLKSESSEAMAPSRLRQVIEKLQSGLQDADVDSTAKTFVIAVRSGDFIRVGNAFVELLKTVLESASIMSLLWDALRLPAATEWLKESLKKQMTQWGTAIVPGVGQIVEFIKGSELIIRVLNLALSAYWVYTGLQKTRDVAAFTAITPPAPPATRVPSEPPTRVEITRWGVANSQPKETRGLGPGRCVHSALLARQDAFRCFTTPGLGGDTIADPCFVLDSGDGLMCPGAPWSTEWILVSGRGNAGNPDAPSTQGLPWGIELAGGVRCTQADTRMNETMSGLSLTYYCPDGSGLFGTPSRGSTWRIKSSIKWPNGSLHSVALRSVWF